MGFLDGKRFLITGVLSNRSIAYGIARACRAQGAELAFSYQGERFKQRVADFASEFGSKLTFDLDVGDDTQITRAFAQLAERWHITRRSTSCVTSLVGIPPRPTRSEGAP